MGCLLNIGAAWFRASQTLTVVALCQVVLESNLTAKTCSYISVITSSLIIRVSYGNSKFIKVQLSLTQYKRNQRKFSSRRKSMAHVTNHSSTGHTMAHTNNAITNRGSQNPQPEDDQANLRPLQLPQEQPNAQWTLIPPLYSDFDNCVWYNNENTVQQVQSLNNQNAYLPPVKFKKN